MDDTLFLIIDRNVPPTGMDNGTAITKGLTFRFFSSEVLHLVV